MVEVSPDRSSKLKTSRQRSKGTSLLERQSSGERSSILIVEDDPATIDFLSEVLVASGFQVHVAACGEDGVSIFEDENKNILCIILDFGLPGMHPTRVLSKFREINAYVKVILASGYPAGDIQKELEFDSIDGFISKPFDPSDLLEEIGRVVN